MARRLRRALHARLARLRRESDPGFSTLEAVVVIPTVVVITMLVVQYVLLWHARNVAEAAAQNALRVARGYQSSAAAGQTSADTYLHDVAGRLLDCSGCVQVTRGSDTVRVRVHAGVTSVVPFGSFSVTETAAGSVEKYSPSVTG